MIAYCGTLGLRLDLPRMLTYFQYAPLLGRGRVSSKGLLATALIVLRAARDVLSTTRDKTMTSNDLSDIKFELLKVRSNRSEDGFLQATGDWEMGSFAKRNSKAFGRQAVRQDSTDPEARQKPTAVGSNGLSVEDPHGQS